MTTRFTSVEICAGAGGQAIGLEEAGFQHLACVENDKAAIETLRLNRLNDWNVQGTDLREWSYFGDTPVTLLAGGVPCPPYSVAGKQKGEGDERDLFPEVLRLVREIRPRVVMIENVRGLLSAKFSEYRSRILDELNRLGYEAEWKLVQAVDFGVPQLRPRSILLAMNHDDFSHFHWPEFPEVKRISVGEALRESMKRNGWKLADEWADAAKEVAPTIVGGSKKHGGADLGPTRAKQKWAELGVDGKGIADELPAPDFTGLPRLTIEQTMILQGFPTDWKISGRKTAAYRQVGNAFPPPVAKALGQAIVAALIRANSSKKSHSAA